MTHRIVLSNGEIIQLIEGNNALHVATDDRGDVGYYLCEIRDSSVVVAGNSGDASGRLVRGLSADRSE